MIGNCLVKNRGYSGDLATRSDFWDEVYKEGKCVYVGPNINNYYVTQMNSEALERQRSAAHRRRFLGEGWGQDLGGIVVPRTVWKMRNIETGDPFKLISFDDNSGELRLELLDWSEIHLNNDGSERNVPKREGSDTALAGHLKFNLPVQHSKRQKLIDFVCRCCSAEWSTESSHLCWDCRWEVVSEHETNICCNTCPNPPIPSPYVSPYNGSLCNQRHSNGDQE